MMKVLVLDGVEEEGLKVLRQEPDIELDIRGKMTEDELVEIIGDYDGMIVRSATKVTARVLEKASKLKVVGRAGVGVDNIDITAATTRGILVVNAPGGNTIAAAEHTIAMMMALARNIPQACATLKAGKWDKKSFMGVEVRDKVLGVIGLGRIGSAVAKRAQGLEMKVVAYDPYITEEKATMLGVKLLPLDDLLQQADFITVHLPLSKESKYIIGERAFSLMKDGVRIINCARGGVVDEKALYEALKSGKVAGAALDVFEQEPTTDSPLFELNNVIATPHLGASTSEAQLCVACDVAEEIVAALKGGFVRNTVNIPPISPQALAAVRPYLDLAEKMGRFTAQVISGRVNQIEITYSGDLAKQEVSPITNSILKGFLDNILQEMVNYINAPVLAKNRGIKVIQRQMERNGDYANLVTIRAVSDKDEISVAGTVFGGHDIRIVSIDGYHVDAVPEGHMLYIPHIDKPRIIGPVGNLIGEQNINISGMQVGRKVVGGKAVMILNVDAYVPDETLEKIKKIDGILGVKNVSI
ncbi:MAG TPA: phosphoglycerate dehydrogenase [Bacillota bacterium]|jgi:D-3-phosphoglycerate dehydrogenase|nr:phosphoglycerate dehydrogenase [Peptococcaceae bacterium MAG4]NLW38311.1 phosphoglycerate dehydrogenase [Peptococcaceae bacterium]HPZ44418.1 phosphoglycerate dehydrogenase [Bacillota bacterium]HQD77098.1 phosphoglycerate dehydrogenase [Bacillota bacterium]HUM59753.1 phosphoglycerate dehydrogenase [Bacillota bacterium]